jgi:hypothetical protein
MKSIIKSVFHAVGEFFSAVALASYAAHQARNNKLNRPKAIIKTNDLHPFPQHHGL